MYNLTNSKDGIGRFTLVVKNRLSLEDLANYITIAIQYDGVDQVEEELPNKRAAVKLAASVIYSEGVESPHFMVGDRDLNDLQAAILERLEKLWSTGS